MQLVGEVLGQVSDTLEAAKVPGFAEGGFGRLGLEAGGSAAIAAATGGNAGAAAASAIAGGLVAAQTRAIAKDIGKALNDKADGQILIANAISNGVAAAAGAGAGALVGNSKVDAINGASAASALQQYNQLHDNNPNADKTDKTTNSVINTVVEGGKGLVTGTVDLLFGDAQSDIHKAQDDYNHGNYGQLTYHETMGTIEYALDAIGLIDGATEIKGALGKEGSKLLSNALEHKAEQGVESTTENALSHTGGTPSVGEGAGTGGSAGSTGNAEVTAGKEESAAAIGNETDKTGTVWDSIKSTQSDYPGSVIPKSFEMTLPNGEKVWVHGNATEHMAEYAQYKAVDNTPEAVRLSSQQELNSLQGALNSATQNGIKYNELITVGGWELKLSPPRQAGGLPAVIHARPVK